VDAECEELRFVVVVKIYQDAHFWACALSAGSGFFAREHF